MNLTAAEMHCLKKNNVNCLRGKLSQPKTYAGMMSKQVQVPNCDVVSATSDNHNLEIKPDGLPEPESLKGRERVFSDDKLVTDKFSCLDRTSAHSISKIKKWVPEDKEIQTKPPMIWKKPVLEPKDLHP